MAPAMCSARQINEGAVMATTLRPDLEEIVKDILLLCEQWRRTTIF